MTDNFLALGALIAFGWVFANAPLPGPTSRAATLRATTTAPAITSYVILNRNVLEARRAPVPLVPNIRPTPAAQTAPEAPVPDPEVQAQDDLDRKAAKEADGYKRVSVLGKASNGMWRAKAYRAQPKVDGTGRVSAD
jgi:hypothetical protein